LFIISHKEKFTVNIERSSFIDRDDFLSIIEFFKKIFLEFDGSSDWLIDDKRIDEVCFWFDRQKYEYKFTESAINRINELKKQFVCERKLDRNKKFDLSILTPETKLFEFQKELISWLVKRNVSLNACDTGAGKTLMTITVVSQLFNDKDIDGVFLVVPDGVQYNWMRSFLVFSTVFKEEDFHIITNKNKIISIITSKVHYIVY